VTAEEQSRGPIVEFTAGESGNREPGERARTPVVSRTNAWDTRIVFIERKQSWWWNAWYEPTATELYGFADSREDASRAMYQAIENAGTPPRRPCPH
jgi:hypothetical protein